MSNFKILPVLVLVSLLSFVVRFGEVASDFKVQGNAAFARDNVDEVNESDAPAPPDISGSAEPAHGDTGLPGIAEGEGIDPQEWRDAGDSTFEYSDVEQNLYKDLVDRRKMLEKREKSILIREALLQAGEREVDQKLRELSGLKNEIESLLEEQSVEERARIGSLVKIYEGMKAKDAATIFNTLDMNILIRIMSQMSERKSAPIFAAMNPDRARTVTILLVEQKQLPDMLPQ